MPAALLAFANDWVDDKRHLRSLLDEGKAIGKALAPLVQAGLHVLPAIHNATVDDVIGAFREHSDQIRVFHFGGHASGSTLLFEDEAGNPAQAHASGLAGYLGEQHGLVLVFLNGCGTEPQVRRLRAAGIKAVVATTHAIQDKVAAEFAEAFYAELATRPLRNAFDSAVHALQTRWGDDPRAVTRDIVPQDEPHTPAWPWVIDLDPAYEAWTLGSEIVQEPDPTSWRWRVLVIAAGLLLLATPLTLSAEARRTTCRVPGLRSVCVAIGIGDVPTTAEQALWDKALTQRSGDGLRAYLQVYPRGAYADEASSRLAGCHKVRVETQGAEHELRYELVVNPTLVHPFPTEEEARSDALIRGNRDAKRECKSLLRAKSELLSTSVDVQIWNCSPAYDRGFNCGFDGEIVCHVRDQIATDEERCRDDNP